jgi:hypothetical protein
MDPLISAQIGTVVMTLVEISLLEVLCRVHGPSSLGVSRPVRTLSVHAKETAIKGSSLVAEVPTLSLLL